MKCDICNCTLTYLKNHEHNYIIKGKEIKFISKRRFCKNCNSLVYDSNLDNIASTLAISIYNEKYGLPKEKIIDLRKKYNLSQEIFSKIIGCAKKTLISYEKGTSIPNDNYLIILKSMTQNPEIILILVESNKEQFTDKEYKYISDKLNLVINKFKCISFDNEEKLNEYNGYSKFSKEKIKNMILFFADKTVLKTKLLKEMFYVDFLFYKLSCKSMTGLEYVKLSYGPVPDNFESILNLFVKENVITYKIVYNNDYECHNIFSKKKFDKDLFTKEELEIMYKVKEKFLNFTSKEIVEFSHKEQAFLKTKYYHKISYDYAFDIKFD